MRLPTSATAAALSLLSLSLSFVQPAWALHESDVGVVDWHKQLIGVPLSGAVPSAPSFLHYKADEGSNRTIIVTATGNNVLAALEPEDGSVCTWFIVTIYASSSHLWRYIFDSEDRIAGYYKSSKTIATLSGPGGSTLRTFSALSGTLLLEKRLHHPSVGALSEPSHLGKEVLFDDDDNNETLYVLSNGCTISSINGTSGETLWTWTAPDQGSLTIYSSIHVTPTALVALGLSKSTASFTLHLTSLDVSSGAVVQSTGVPSSIADPLTQFAVLSTSASSSSSSSSSRNGKGETPVILWLSHSSLFYLPLSRAALSAKPTPRPRKAKLEGTGAGLERIVDVGLSALGHAVVSRNDGSAFVVKVSGDGEGDDVGVETAWEFAGSASSPTQADSLYAGGTDARGRPAVARVFWDHVVQKASAYVFAVQGQAEQGEAIAVAEARPFAFGFDTRSHGVLSHVALDGPTPHTNTHARLLVTTTTGAVQLWSSSSSSSVNANNDNANNADGEQEPTLHWTREEALAAAVVAEFVELPPARGDDTVNEQIEGFWGRLGRQVRDAQGFPQYVVHFVRRFVSGSSSPALPSNATVDYRTLSNAATPPSLTQTTTTTTLARDAFGFRQLLITATLFGKVYALDASTGAIVWSRVLGMGWVGRAGMGGRVVPVKLFVVRGVGDLDLDGEGEEKGRGPEVVLVGQRRADNSLVDTVIFHINALTGEDARPPQAQTPIEAELELEGENGEGKAEDGGVLEGTDVVSGPVVEAYLLNAEDRKIVVLLDEFLQAYLYPDTPATQAVFAASLPQLSFPLRANVETRHRVVGHKIALPPKEQSHHRAVAHPVWALSFPEGEDVQAIVPQTPTRGGHGQGKGRGQDQGAASLGKVLGSRSTLYKYLDERLFVVRTVARKSANGGEVMCGVYVVDSAKGTVVYHAEVKAAAAASVGGRPGTGAGAGAGTGGCDVKASLVENWLVYHYYESEVAGGNVGGAKGYRMVSVEFYEGKQPDDKIQSSSLSAYSNDTLNYSVYEQAYVFPSAITALATTTTKFGITSKDLIVATTNRKIQSFPRRIFDPRRPSRKTTAEEQEEFLIQYDPLIPNDPKRALSHNYDVANVQKIITSPALLESTSLVFAYGLDMFLTRVAPSNTFDVLSENFNKVQLVLTVTGLLAAILITRPMVKRKSLKEKWYN
ncbi:hypothetical protein CVT25_007866 [Psilocybe cyanescens]|uniref:ER membrane protein complex subunit 1 n=1 Tax=Psilocybe cyanescens TaxID=93625 RepID=A0A409VXT6_PSICY|nr:hypothetical protein CVT25_007866 [Psilocybe cyanescens]